MKETRVPPHNLDAERAVLAGLMLDPDRFDEVVDIVRPGDWYGEHHVHIWRAISELRRRGAPLDTVTVRDQLRAHGKLTAESDEYLLRLTNEIPVVAHINEHAEIVEQTAMHRKMLLAVQQVAADGYGAVESVSDFLDRAESLVLSVSHSRRSKNFGPQHIAEVLLEDHRLLEEQAARGSGVAGTKTGIDVYDRMTTGMYPGDLLIVAGRPGMGKTAFAMNIAEHVAEHEGVVAVFSLEMTRVQLVRRMKCARARVPMERLRANQLQAADWSKLTTAAGELANLPIIIDDDPDVTPMKLRSRSRRVAAENDGIALIVVDYLQLMRPEVRHESTEKEVAETSRALKLLAKELGCPVMALSQLSRECEKRSDKRPQVSDLRYSGAIEQDADVIAFLYRDEQYNKKTEDKNVAEIIIGKQRSGPTGTVRCAFFGEHTRFENLVEGLDDFSDPPERDSGVDCTAKAREAARQEGRA